MKKEIKKNEKRYKKEKKQKESDARCSLREDDHDEMACREAVIVRNITFYFFLSRIRDSKRAVKRFKSMPLP